MADTLSPVELTRKLVKINTMNPPGGEVEAARYLGEYLSGAGLKISYHELSSTHTGLLAILKGSGEKPPLCFTGHLDTVPLGDAPWTRDPYSGEISGGKLWGRGSSDMKSGVAVCVACAMAMATKPPGKGDLFFVFTCAEETGSQGARQMAETGVVPKAAGALVVAEPTGLAPFLGHKGALWLEGGTVGKSAHGSMPDHGDNAIYKAARSVLALEDFFQDRRPHPQLGRPTVNVGTFSGGSKINMVPDRAAFAVDIRSVPGMDHHQVLADVQMHLGNDVSFEATMDAPPVLTEKSDPWIQTVFEMIKKRRGKHPDVGYASYFTDASIIKSAMGDPPTLILGPGEPHMAHQTDEFCYIEKIEKAYQLYMDIAAAWWGI